MAAGIQSGKTTAGCLWIMTKAANAKPGDNIIVIAPTYKILMQATLPKLLSIFKNFGVYRKADQVIDLKNGVTVYIRSMTNSTSLEGITDVEAIWLDEGGLISKYAWENVEGRSAFRQCQIFISTTPYALNWLYKMWEQWNAKKRDDVEFIQFTSKENPYFPDEEFYRQQKLLDYRRFAMKYMGQFGKMEGLVYPDLETISAFPLPQGTRYFAGVDWGYANPFVITIRALLPDGRQFRVGEFYKTGMMVEEIVTACKSRKQIYNIELFICDPSNPTYIEALNRAGCAAVGGNNNIRIGIDRHSQLMKQNKFSIFKDENPNGIDEYSTYHYPEIKDYKIDDDQKEPEPVKQNDHGTDADRYVTMYLWNAGSRQFISRSPENSQTAPRDPLDRIEWLKRGGSSKNGGRH